MKIFSINTYQYSNLLNKRFVYDDEINTPAAVVDSQKAGAEGKNKDKKRGKETPLVSQELVVIKNKEVKAAVRAVESARASEELGKLGKSVEEGGGKEISPANKKRQRRLEREKRKKAARKVTEKIVKKKATPKEWHEKAVDSIKDAFSSVAAFALDIYISMKKYISEFIGGKKERTKKKKDDEKKAKAKKEAKPKTKEDKKNDKKAGDKKEAAPPEKAKPKIDSGQKPVSATKKAPSVVAAPKAKVETVSKEIKSLKELKSRLQVVLKMKPKTAFKELQTIRDRISKGLEKRDGVNLVVLVIDLLSEEDYVSCIDLISKWINPKNRDIQDLEEIHINFMSEIVQQYTKEQFIKQLRALKFLGILILPSITLNIYENKNKEIMDEMKAKFNKWGFTSIMEHEQKSNDRDVRKAATIILISEEVFDEKEEGGDSIEILGGAMYEMLSVDSTQNTRNFSDKEILSALRGVEKLKEKYKWLS